MAPILLFNNICQRTISASYGRHRWSMLIVGDQLSTRRLSARRQTDEYLLDVLNARVYDACIVTKLDHAIALSANIDNQVYLKREVGALLTASSSTLSDTICMTGLFHSSLSFLQTTRKTTNQDTQPVNSFKIRGAFNKMVKLSKEQLARGVIACSAGNHAQVDSLYSLALQQCSQIFFYISSNNPELFISSSGSGYECIKIRLQGSDCDAIGNTRHKAQRSPDIRWRHNWGKTMKYSADWAPPLIIEHHLLKIIAIIFTSWSRLFYMAAITTKQRVKPNVFVRNKD